jgi:Xaa-Pro aminopeptidase
MDEAGIDAALLLYHRDVLYYAGTARPASLLVVSDRHSSGGPQRTAKLFVRRGMREIQDEATVEDILPVRGFSSIVEAAAGLGLEGGVLGIELDATSTQLHQRISAAFVGWDFVDVSSTVLDQRLVKDEGEIAATRRAATVADAGHLALARVAAAGMSELELAAEVERAMRLAGHEGYQPLRHPGARGGGVLLMSGDNLTVRGGYGLVVTGGGMSPATPYGASARVVQRGDLIVLDIGSTRHGYTADESRTFVAGNPTSMQRALFGVACQAEEAVLEAVKPDVPVAHLYAVAEKVVDEGADPLLAPGSLVLPGFVGHGVGLELDEPPVLWTREEMHLREGMVLAIEVEVSAPAQRMMAKVEDTIVVRSDGAEPLTTAPRALTICE